MSTLPSNLLPNVRLRLALTAIVLGISPLLNSCSKTGSAPPPPKIEAATSSEASAATINWLEGSVDEAFTEAHDSGKPVLLYWGAQWCPPCNQLQSTVFKRPAFIEQTHHFVAVHLDGDSTGAQQWGEHFGISGYPTLIVLREDRTELMRISGDTDIEQFPKVLALALRQTQSAAQLLETALATPAKLSNDDWTLLALYGWDIDQQRLMKDNTAVDTLSRLASACPEPNLKKRFTLLSLMTAADQAKAPEQAFNADQKAQALQLLPQLVEEPTLLQQNLGELEYAGAKIVLAATAAGSDARQALASKLIAAMDAAYANPNLSIRHRLDSSLAELNIYEAEHPKTPLPAALVAKFKARADWANAEAKTPQQRQAVISATADLLDEIGLKDQAEKLLLAEVPTARAPYYYMESLADYAKARGDTSGALNWLHKAYDLAEGPATRTQWGTYYLNGLLELTPKDNEAIEKTATALIAEIAANPNSYYQRTRQRWAKSGGKLKDWSAKNNGTAVLAHLRAKMDAVCPTLDKDSEAQKSCQSWLATT